MSLGCIAVHRGLFIEYMNMASYSCPVMGMILVKTRTRGIKIVGTYASYFNDTSLSKSQSTRSDPSASTWPAANPPPARTPSSLVPWPTPSVLITCPANHHPSHYRAVNKPVRSSTFHGLYQPYNMLCEYLNNYFNTQKGIFPSI